MTWTPPRSPASEIFQDFARIIAADLVIFDDWDNGRVEEERINGENVLMVQSEPVCRGAAG